MIEEKENFKYFEILEVDTIKQEEMKEKIKKSTSDGREISRRPSSGYLPRKIFGTILEMDEGRTSANEPENKKKLIFMHPW